LFTRKARLFFLRVKLSFFVADTLPTALSKSFPILLKTAMASHMKRKSMHVELEKHAGLVRESHQIY
jgi:hypothetical protein